MSELGKRGWGIIVWIAKSCTWGLITRISVIGWQFIILKWQEMEIHRIYQWITENLWTSDWLGCEKCKWNPHVYHTGYFQEALRSISSSIHLRLLLKIPYTLIQLCSTKKNTWIFRGTEPMLLTGDLQWLSYKVKATGECFCFVNKVQCILKSIK